MTHFVNVIDANFFNVTDAFDSLPSSFRVFVQVWNTKDLYYDDLKEKIKYLKINSS